MTTITSSDELVRVLAARIRSASSNTNVPRTLVDLFETIVRSIGEHGHYDMGATTFMPCGAELFTHLFAPGETAQASMALVRFMGAALQYIGEEAGDGDVIPLAECAPWFLEALGWNSRMLQARQRGGHLMLVSSEAFHKQTGLGVAIVLPNWRVSDA